MTPPLKTVVHLDHAAGACRMLIRAYAVDLQHVDWSDVQAALAEALAAFGLPEDYFDVTVPGDAAS